MIAIHFHDNLSELLPGKITTRPIFLCQFRAQGLSIKDVIESLGVPHPEIENYEAG